jgi:UDP-GlcNAc:undecaprenyl-phosphate GlcNAc-1-phosphate transferase
MALLLGFVAAFVFTVILVPLVGQAGRVRGLSVHPSSDRWARRSVPFVGGVAMIGPLVFVVALAGLAPPLMPVLVASTLMFFVGLVDDLRTFRPTTKLVLQMGVAATFLSLAPSLHITGSPTIDLLLGFLWIVGITNAVNLLDNMDGLAAGVSIIAALAFIVVFSLGGDAAAEPLAVGMAAFAGVVSGFLLFNFYPASIFMGDSGSHLLGCFLATTALMAAPALTPRLAPVAAIPVVLLLIPIFDTLFVALSRGLSGRSAFLGGRDHTSHRLVALGIGERRAVLVLYAMALAGGAVGIGLVGLPPGLAFGLVGLYVAALGLVGMYLGHVQVSRGTQPLAPLPTEITTRYRLYEVVLDAVLVTGAYYLSFIMRFRDAEFDQFVPYFTKSVPLVVGVQVGTLWLSGKYRRVWGSLGAHELFALARASAFGVAASVIAVLYLNRFEGYSRWMFAYDAILAPTFVVSARVALSALDDYLRVRRSRGRTALIYGAGKGGALAAREMLQNAAIGLTPIGFIDDDPGKRRLRVEGVPVVSSLEDLAAFLDRRPGRVSVIVVGISELSRDRLDRIVELAAARGIAVRRLRFDLEEVRRPSSAPAGVVRFPRA